MATIITREVGATAKGTPLTNAELDNNFINLNTAISSALTGPASVTDNALVRFDGITGTLVQNSVGLLSDTGDLTGLVTVDTTTLEVTNVKALDGTPSFAIASATGILTINDNKLTLQDEADNTKKAQFQLSGLTTGTTRTYTLPDANGTLALLSATQTFSGTTTFTAGVTFSSSGNNINVGTSQAAGLLTMGGTSGTGIITLGRSTLSQTTNIQTGATALGSTKTINFGTNGLDGSITDITIGSSTGTSTTTVNGSFVANNAVTFSSTTSNINIGTSQTSGTTYIGGVDQTADLVFGQSQSSQTTSIQTNSTLSGNVKTINIGTGGLDGSTTDITIGSAVVGASSNIVIHGSITVPQNMSIGTIQPNAIVMSSGSGFSFIEPNTSISGWTYTGVSKSIATEETAVTGLFFNPDGTKMYVCGSSGDDVNEYALSSAFEMSTATFTAAFSTAAQDTASGDIYFKSDGLAFYLIGDTNNAIFQYTLGTAWDITTASYASKTFSVATQDTNPSGIWFKPDGTEMYVVGYVTDTVYKYTLSTAWDVSTASYAGVSFSVAAEETLPVSLTISDDGLHMYVLGSSGDDINHYELSTAWDITTASFIGDFYIGFQETNPSAIYMNSNFVWVAGSTFDTIFQYYRTGAPLGGPVAIQQISENLLLTGYTRINNNAYVDGAVFIDGVLTLGSTLTAGNITANQISTSTSSITLGSAVSTGNTNITVAQSSGPITIGGTAGTGIITLGQSTLSQTTNIQVGITSTGNTKTINIGTNGASGSTTTITLGSAAGTSNTTINGTVTATSFAGSGSGLTSLNAANITSGTIDAARLPSYVDDVLEYANLAAFPASGETGKIYVAIDTSKTYRWSGSVYIAIGSGGAISVSDTAPASPAEGQLWWSSTTGVLSIYYNDGTSTQWVSTDGGTELPSETGPVTNPYSNQYILTGSTTNATETEIFVNGTANARIPVALNTVCGYTIDIVVKRTDVAGQYAMFQLKSAASNISGTVADIGNVYEVVVARTIAGLDVDARASDTTDSINVYVTGLAGQTYTWRAVVNTVET